MGVVAGPTTDSDEKGALTIEKSALSNNAVDIGGAKKSKPQRQ